MFVVLSPLVLAESDLRNGDMWSSVAGRIVGGVEVPSHTSWPWQVQEYKPESRKHKTLSLRVVLLE